jgi:hypothetical protein
VLYTHKEERQLDSLKYTRTMSAPPSATQQPDLALVPAALSAPLQFSNHYHNPAGCLSLRLAGQSRFSGGRKLTRRIDQEATILRTWHTLWPALAPGSLRHENKGSAFWLGRYTMTATES